jgi:hypothetical protein
VKLAKRIPRTDGLPENDPMVMRLESRIALYTWFAWVLIAIGFLTLVVPLLSDAFGYTLFQLPPNEIGDYAAGITGSLFALAGVFFLYIAFLGQRIQILLQQYEIRQTQEEIRLQTSAIQAQNEQLQEQNEEQHRTAFENNFFQLVSLLASLRDDLKYKELVGPELMRHVFQEFIKAHRLHTNQMKCHTAAETIDQSFDRVYVALGFNLDHYFRNVYTVMKYIKQNENKNEERFYSNILRAQLSDIELKLIFYYGLTPIAAEKFKPLIEEFHMLKHLRMGRGQLVGDAYLDDLLQYSPQAYGLETAEQVHAACTLNT